MEHNPNEHKHESVPEENQIPKNQNKKTLSVPSAIIVAGFLIAGAIYLSSVEPAPPVDPQLQAQADQEVRLKQMTPVTENDHIRGDINAPVVIVEYSDLDCPFCKRYHETMKQVVEEYGDNVAWVYRHHPIDQLHPNARKASVASECANEQAGNEAFWKYIDRYLDLAPINSQGGVDVVLVQIAKDIGLNEAVFNECLVSGKHDKFVEDQVQNALLIGANGTPWSAVIDSKGKIYPINGAQPFASVKQIIDLALKK